MAVSLALTVNEDSVERPVINTRVRKQVVCQGLAQDIHYGKPCRSHMQTLPPHVLRNAECNHQELMVWHAERKEQAFANEHDPEQKRSECQ